MENGKVSLFVGWITLFIMGTDLFVVSPLLPFISDEYDVKPSLAGWMVTAFSVTYALAAPFYGWVSDKSGRKLFITGGLLLFSISNILTALSPSFTCLIISRILAGVSVAAITPLIYAIIGDIAPSHRKGTWLSIVISGHLTALWIGAPIGLLLESFIGWRSAFISLAIMGCILSIVNIFTWRTIPHHDHRSQQRTIKLINILWSISVTTLWAIAMYALYTYLGAALYSENQFSKIEISLSVIFYGIGAVIGSLTSGRLTDKLGERRVSRATLMFLAIILLLLGFLFSAGPWIYLIVFIWAYVGYAGFTSYQSSLSVEFPNERGRVLGWNNTGLYIGITLGAWLGGYIVKEWGYAFLPFFCSFVAVISLIICSLKINDGK